MSMDAAKQRNNKAILKSTSLLGGSSAITILIGMIKTKFVAVLLGPEGVGFMSVLNGFREIVSTIFGMGLNSSGVRQIAASYGKGDEAGALKVVKSLRILVWIGGVSGLIAMIIGSGLWSSLTFKTDKYASSIAWLGLAVFAVAISAGQTCVLQGRRRIGDVAKVNILGALLGAALSIGCFLLWGMNGVVTALIATAGSSLFASWWFVRRIGLPSVTISSPEFAYNARKLFTIGFPIAASGLLTTGTAYAIRLFLTREAGLEAVGIYQAAFTLSGALVNFVLAAMGTDYYPRLSAVSEYNDKIDAEVNAQTEIAVLITTPALVVTVSILPVMVNLLYSNKFSGSYSILRWAVFGVLGRVVSWPMGFILLAKARSLLYMFSELLTGMIHICLTVICYKLIGLEGCGISFALLYLWYIVFMILVSRKLANMKWNKTVWRTVVYSFLILIVADCVQVFVETAIVKYAGSILLIGISVFLSLRRLSSITGIKWQSIARRNEDAR